MARGWMEPASSHETLSGMGTVMEDRQVTYWQSVPSVGLAWSATNRETWSLNSLETTIFEVCADVWVPLHAKLAPGRVSWVPDCRRGRHTPCKQIPAQWPLVGQLSGP